MTAAAFIAATTVWSVALYLRFRHES